MIQASHGAGLSGITANAAKGGKASTGGLFAKLLAILEKHSLSAAKSGIPASANSGLESRLSGNAVKALNIHPVAGHDAGLKSNGKDSDTALIATALQINTANPRAAHADKADQHSAASLLIGSQAPAQAARQGFIASRDGQSKAFLSLDTPAGHGRGDIEPDTSANKKPVLSAGKNPSVMSGALLNSQPEAPTIPTGPVLALSDKPGLAEPNKASANIQSNQTSPNDQAEENINPDKAAASARNKAAATLPARLAGQRLADTQPTTTPEVASPAPLEKGIVSAEGQRSMESQLARAGLSAGKVKAKADQNFMAAQASAPLLAAHLIQHQQGGASAAPGSASVAPGMAQQSLDANGSDTSGQQSSDKGSQEGRNLLTSVDTRSSQPTAATGNSFSSYLNHKSDT
ncbi:MAG: hypothetical protein R8L58_00485, partial [Mariprofundaceae bacterium]